MGSIPTRSRQRGAGAALLVVLAAALVCGVNARPAAAQSAPGDSTRAVPQVTTQVDGDSVARVVTLSDSTRAPAPPPKPLHKLRGAEGDTLAGGIGRDAPSRVMLRSLLVPGWGQLYNRKWLKAGIVIAGEGALITSYVVQNHLARTRTDATARAQAIDARQASLWFYAGAALVSMLDAYVDAHLYTFGKELAPVEVRLTPASPRSADGVACALTIGF